MYGKPQPAPFTRALFCQEWLHQFRDARVRSVLNKLPPNSGPLFWFLSKDPCMETPNQYLSPEPCFARNGCISSRSKGPKCARLSAPSLWATVLVSFKGPMYGNPQLVPFTRALFCPEWLHQFRDPRVQSVLDSPPPHFGPLFWFLSKDPCMQSPNQYLSPRHCFARNGCINFQMQGSKLCSTIRPLTVGHCLGFFQGTHVWKAPTNTFHHSLV